MKSSSTGASTGTGPSGGLSPFYVFAAANIIAALYAPIQDCDEVFNYWEPTHYLNHGYGLQTWEYSPEYAIRSWAYSGLHAAVIQAWRLVPYTTKTSEFYFLRIVLALVCAQCESRFSSAIAKVVNRRAAFFFFMIMISSPGIYHAAPAYLPSSFAMYTTMLGFSAFMDIRGGVGIPAGIFWFAGGALLGWPFAGALIIPFVLEQLLLTLYTRKFYAGVKNLLDGALRSVALLALQTGIDSFFYKECVCVPLNIVLYNVFSGGNKGPNIYGVEPWHFYLRNLALNFNVWFLLALGALPLFLLLNILRPKSTLPLTRGLAFLTPFYLWLGIFTLQPHKEERFMYPSYPALALNAAVSFDLILSILGTAYPGDAGGEPSSKPWISGLVTAFAMGALNLGILRSTGLTTAYSAPLKIYAPLQNPGIAGAGLNVCLGKEWYRFPSSYHIPNHMRAKFVKSEFSGLLPGEFSEAKGPGLFPGTWMMPDGMNDENKEDLGKYTHIGQCDFLVDAQFVSVEPTALEPDYVADEETWERLSCRSFLDTNRTSFLGRLLWIPDVPFIPERFRRKWGQYCLLKRKRSKE